MSALFLAYAFGCLSLAGFLSQHSPETDKDVGPIITQLPPMKVKELPDLAGISHIPDRKQAFINLLLPMIEWRNKEAMKFRAQVQQMMARLEAGQSLTKDQFAKLATLRDRYRVGEDEYPEPAEALSVLQRRVDVIPQGMVLAQAAAESGWGTSRFATQANNLFGQWCYSQGCGLVPLQRSEGAQHEVQRFATVNDAIDAYYRNINSHGAYRELRQMRAQLREEGKPVTGEALVAGLLRYSSRGQAYVDELRELIRYNDLANATPAQVALD